MGKGDNVTRLGSRGEVVNEETIGPLRIRARIDQIHMARVTEEVGGGV